MPSRANTTDYRPYASVVVTDGLFRCPSWNATMQHSVYKDEDNVFTNDAWFYHFNHVSSFNPGFWGQNYTFCDNEVCHASELPYVFHPNGAVDNVTFLPEENDLAVLMQTFWGNLAKYNDPGKDMIYNLSWTAFDTQNQYGMMFNASNTQLMSNFDNHTCQFWNSLNYNWIK